MKLPQDFRDHPIRAFAVLCVAAIAIYIGYMGWQLNDTLAGPGWCKAALGAEKASSTDGTIKGLDACVGLLTIQLKSLSTNSHILFGSLALCLLTLIVVVIAGAKLAGKFADAQIDISADAPAAAQTVAKAADAKADEISSASQ
jgi:hypothetical protein